MYSVYKNLILATVELLTCSDIDTFEQVTKELPVEACDALLNAVNMRIAITKSMPESAETLKEIELGKKMLNILKH